MKRPKRRPRLLEELPEDKARQELLQACNELAIVLLIHAALDKRLRFQQGQGSPPAAIEITKNDLTRYEYCLDVGGINKLTRKLRNALAGFDLAQCERLLQTKVDLPPVRKHTSESARERRSDALFGLQDGSLFIVMVNSIHETSNAWRKLAQASTVLAEYYRTGMEERYAEAIDLFADAGYRGDEFCEEFRAAVDSVRRYGKPKGAYKKGDRMSPADRADSAVGSISGKGGYRIDEYRKDYKRYPV